MFLEPDRGSGPYPAPTRVCEPTRPGAIRGHFWIRHGGLALVSTSGSVLPIEGDRPKDGKHGTGRPPAPPGRRDALGGEDLRHSRHGEPGIPQLHHPPACRLRQLQGPAEALSLRPLNGQGVAGALSDQPPLKLSEGWPSRWPSSRPGALRYRRRGPGRRGPSARAGWPP